MTRRFRSPYPGYDILDQWDSASFDEITREVLARRMTRVPPAPRFFEPAEWDCCRALCDAVMPQDDRAEPVPIAPWIDAGLADWTGTGTRYADMPPQPHAWRQGLAALDAEARARHGARFADLSRDRREALLRAVDAEETATDWGDLPPRRFLRQAVLKDVVAIYYAHPAAMSEIGFGGPANPRGYVRLGPGRADPWEAPPGEWRNAAPKPEDKEDTTGRIAGAQPREGRDGRAEPGQRTPGGGAPDPAEAKNAEADGRGSGTPAPAPRRAGQGEGDDA